MNKILKQWGKGPIRSWQDQELVALKNCVFEQLQYSLSTKDPKTPHKFRLVFSGDLHDYEYEPSLFICMSSIDGFSMFQPFVGKQVSSAYKVTDNAPKIVIYFKDGDVLYLEQGL